MDSQTNTVSGGYRRIKNCYFVKSHKSLHKIQKTEQIYAALLTFHSSRGNT